MLRKILLVSEVSQFLFTNSLKYICMQLLHAITFFVDCMWETQRDELKLHTRYPEKSCIEIKRGMYGSVVELKLDGERVLGKVLKLNKPVNSVAERKKWHNEIRMVLYFKHPNIALSKGVCFLPDIPPILIMECLMSTLHNYLVNHVDSKLSMEKKASILHGIVNGLDYLHNHRPAIVHGGLTAKNVLLDSYLRPKISDFGNAQIVERGMDTGTETQPGPQPDTSIDILSFGDISLFTIVQKQMHLLSQTYRDTTGELVYRSEEERRQTYILEAEKQLSLNQTLLEMIKQCLSTPSKHPCTGDLLKIFAQLAPCEFTSPYSIILCMYICTHLGVL